MPGELQVGPTPYSRPIVYGLWFSLRPRKKNIYVGVWWCCTEQMHIMDLWYANPEKGFFWRETHKQHFHITKMINDVWVSLCQGMDPLQWCFALRTSSGRWKARSLWPRTLWQACNWFLVEIEFWLLWGTPVTCLFQDRTAKYFERPSILKSQRCTLHGGIYCTNKCHFSKCYLGKQEVVHLLDPHWEASCESSHRCNWVP